MQRTLLTLALIATAGVSYAQTMPAGEPTDPYGRPLVGRNDWVRQPGDQAGPRGAAMQPSMQYSGPATTTVTTYSGNVALFLAFRRFFPDPPGARDPREVAREQVGRRG